MVIELIQILVDRKITIGFAESCTGGALASAITQVSGASKCFAGSIVSYQDQVKQAVLQVPWQVLKEYGAVSEQTVRAMLEGCFEIMAIDLGVAVTGFAEPSGQPVFLAIGYRDQEPLVKKLTLTGNRTENIEQIVQEGLTLIRKQL